MMRSLVLASVVLAAAAGDAAADARSLYAEGQEAYKAQHYDVAAAKFVAAYEAEPDPVYLFNAAQAYRFGGDCVKAADYYKQFLAKVPDPPNGDKIRGWSTEMEVCAKERQKPDPVGSPPPKEPPPPPVETPHEGGTNGLRIAAFATAGLAVVGFGAAVYFGLEGRDAAEKRDAVCPKGCTWDPAFEDRRADLEKKGEKANQRAYIALVGGGVAIAASVALFVLSSGGDEREPRVAIVPTVDGGLVVGAFRF